MSVRDTDILLKMSHSSNCVMKSCIYNVTIVVLGCHGVTIRLSAYKIIFMLRSAEGNGMSYMKMLKRGGKRTPPLELLCRVYVF